MNLKEFKQKKERGLSVRGAAQDLLDNADRYESVLIVALDENKQVNTSYSANGTLELVGLAEMAKTMLIEDTTDD